MFKRLMSVIGQVLGITQPATLVCQGQHGQTGGDSSTARAVKPVSKESKPKRKVAKQDTLAQSHIAETSPVPTRTKKSSMNGTSQAIRAPQSVKQKSKPKSKAVLKTTAVKSSKQTPSLAQVVHGQDGSQVQIPALQIRLHAKPQVRAKQARALRTTQALLQALEQVPALTLMEAQSGERGKRKATVSQSSQQKPKRLVVKSTTAVKSRNKEQLRQDSQERGSQSATAVSKTRQPAKQVQTKKQKVAGSTTQAQKRTSSKTRVQTRTARQSQAHGS